MVQEYAYVYNGSALMQMVVQTTVDDGTPTTDTLYFSYDASGIPMSLVYNGTDYFYTVNPQGDVTAILNTSGTAVAEYTYDAWGNILSITGSMADTLGAVNPLTYRGYVYDTETGFYYVSSRYYDTVIGRWISPEPNVYNGEFDEGAGLLAYNVYAYCANNPVMYVDSDGEGIFLAMAIGAGVGALISGAVKAYQNYKSGQKWYKGMAISMLAGGIGGAISCISIPGVSSWVCAAVFGAAGNLTTKVILGEIKSIGDLTSAIAVGAGAGLLGNAASKVLIKGVTKYFGTLTKAKQKAFLSRIGRITNAQLRAIRQQVSKGLTPPVLEQLSIVQRVFDDYRYIYGFVCNQSQIDRLIANQNCLLIIPESLQEKISVDQSIVDVHIDSGS